MLRYRVLLVDTENTYERPVQAFFNSVDNIDDWARTNLRRAGPHAYVVVYRVTEIEVGIFKKSDYDQGAVASLQPAGEETGKSST